MTRLSIMAISAGLSLAILSLAQADDETGKNEKPPKSATQKESTVDIIPVTIHPVSLPKPALKYHLLPSFLEQTPGNAATLYGNAFLLVARIPNSADKYNQAAKWLAMPLDEFPRAGAQETLDSFADALGQVEQAARRERCDWDVSIRQSQNFGSPASDWTEVRCLASLLALRARLQMADGKFAEAIESLRVGYSLARHYGQQPLLIKGVMGKVVIDIMNEQVLMFCQLPEAPNLYWSITALPSPMIDFRKSMEGELDGIYLQFPRLQAVRRARYSPEQWDRELREFVSGLAPLLAVDKDHPVDLSANLATTLAAVPTLKAALVAAGYAQKELDAMPPAQIVLLYFVETYDELRDNIIKWSGLPYWQAAKGLEALERNLPSTEPQGLIPVGSLLLAGGMPKIAFNLVRAERTLAVLRCIEAMRLYAATHEGKLPATLDDIQEVPIPLNPVTGKPFGYRLDGQTAVLDADGSPTRNQDRQYRVTVAK